MVVLVEFGELNHLQNVMCVQRMDTNTADRVRVHARTYTGEICIKAQILTDISMHIANSIIMIRNNNSTYNNIYFLIIEKNKVK